MAELLKSGLKGLKARVFTFIISSFLVFNLFSQTERLNQHDIILHNPPVPEFSCLNLCLGDSTKFINQSTGASTFFWWIYGPGAIIIDSSAQQDIVFYFPAAGTYTVVLQADNGHISTITKIVTIGNTTVADFSFQRCANNFNNMSACATNFLWDFGDGGTSTDSLPVHQYADTGFYQVTLIANNGTAYDTLKQQIYVDEIGIPDPMFTVSSSNDTLFYQLTNFMPYEIIIFYFGDGSSDTLKTANQSYHIYQNPGSYVVNAFLRNSCGMQFHDTLVTMMFQVSVASYGSSSQQQITIYPNPCNEIITIESGSNNIEKIILYDVFGNSILESENRMPQKINKINISSFSFGAYYIQCITSQGVINRKIIKQ